MNQHEFAGLTTAIMARLRDFPSEAVNELFKAMGRIERKYDLTYKLSDEERAAIDESRAAFKRGEFATMEEVDALFADRLKDYDADAAGKEAFENVIGRLRKRSGEEQQDAAELLFALINEYQFDDIPLPPSK